MKRAASLLILIILLSSCSHVIIHDNFSVEKGVLDLRGQNLQENWVVPLRGDWAFFWDRFAYSDTTGNFVTERAASYIKVPQHWNSVEESYPSFGTAVYSLTILADEESELLGIKLTNLNPNYILYVNGKRAYQSGSPNESRSLSRPGNVSVVVPLSVIEGRIDIIVTMSNWHTNKPGIFRLPVLGRYEMVLQDLMREKIRESLFIGAMVLLSFFLFFSFLYNREEQSTFWLGMVIQSAVLYTAVKGPLVLMDLYPSTGGEIRSKIIYLVLLCYPYFTYKQYSSKQEIRINRFIGKVDSVIVALFSLFLLIAPKSLYTRFELVFVIHALILSLYIIFVLIRDVAENRTLDAFLALTGDILLFLAVVFSMVDNSVPMNDTGLAVYFFCFCLFQTVLQARFASKNYLMVKVLSERNRTLRSQKDQYENQALMDHLTRVKNRRSLDSYLKKSWEMVSTLEQGIGIIMVDIDKFKNYNDALGHKEGDTCLVEVAKALSGSLKRNQDFIARYGGEEFIVVVQGVDSLANMVTIGEHLREAVEHLQIPHPDSPCSPYVTISVGVEFMIPGKEPVMNADELIRRADMALYLAKSRGRNRVETVNSRLLEGETDLGLA